MQARGRTPDIVVAAVIKCQFTAARFTALSPRFDGKYVNKWANSVVFIVTHSHVKRRLLILNFILKTTWQNNSAFLECVWINHRCTHQAQVRNRPHILLHSIIIHVRLQQNPATLCARGSR